MSNVFYISGSKTVYDQAVLCDDKMYRGMYSGKTLAEINEEHSGTVLISFDEALERIDEINKSLYSEIKEISEEKYIDSLEMMPPLRWSARYGVNSFLCREALESSWYSCYVEYDGRYFSGTTDTSSETLEQMATRFKEYAKTH